MLQLNFRLITNCPITVFNHPCISSGALNSCISDNFPIHFLFKTKHQSESETCMFRIFEDMNYEKFKNSIFSADFSNILLTLDPNSMILNFNDHLLLTYKRCLPSRKKLAGMLIGQAG